MRERLAASRILLVDRLPPARAILGQENERQPGAVALRTRSAALRATTTANQAPTDRP